MNAEQHQKAQAFADRINQLAGGNYCRWCEYSRAWFTFLPPDMQPVADKIAELFRAGGMKVYIGPDATEEQIQISARVQ